MKILLDWLTDFVEMTCSPEELGESLTMAGLALERIEGRGEEVVYELEVPTNRPDCLSHIGVAREIATLIGATLKEPQSRVESIESDALPFTLEVDDPALCPRYSARIVRDVKIAESPSWLIQRLEAIQAKPVNNVVDITNYVMFEYGHPLHAFDLKALDGSTIRVRRADANESIVTIDGIERKLIESMLVIADAEKPVAIAGVMGGLPSEVSEKTADVLIESAYFDPLSIRATSQQLGLRTEASIRFERGADIEITLKVIERASALLQELCGGRPEDDAHDVYPNPRKREQIKLRHDRIHRLLGRSFPPETVVNILGALGFQILGQDQKTIEVEVPSYRVDVSREVDLVEEIARISGYDAFASQLPEMRIVSRGRGSKHRFKDRVRQLVGGLGYAEVINYSMVNPEDDERFRPDGARAVLISNPLTEDASFLRSNLLSSLVLTARENLKHGEEQLRIFEVSEIFRAQKGKTPKEAMHLGVLTIGVEHADDWRGVGAPDDFFSLKGTIEYLLEQLGSDVVLFESAQSPVFHPHRAGRIVLKQRTIGMLGQLSPHLAREYDLRHPLFLGEVDLEALFRARQELTQTQAIPTYPVARRDISILVDRAIPFGEIQAALRAQTFPCVREIRLFDRYEGEEVEDNSVSLSFHVVLQSEEKTLTQDEIEEIKDDIVVFLKDRYMAELR